MITNINKVISINLFFGYFLALSGYYIVLIMLSNIAPGLESRNLTIPLRLIIVATITLHFFLKPRLRFQSGLLFFLLFALAYIVRILIEYSDNISTFHITDIDFFLYFISFVLIPILLISESGFTEDNYGQIFMAVIVGTLILSIFSFIFYKDIVGYGVRISQVINEGENDISPLALSYCSSLGIGIGITYLLTNNVNWYVRILIYTSISLSFIPFYLGASRGSVLSLNAPFIFYFTFVKGIKNRLIILLSISFLSLAFIVATEYLGSAFFPRFGQISEDIASGSDSAIRLEIWYASLMQFIDNPIFGNSLESKFVNFHPHNILVEILITTGIIGFVPFILFIYQIFKKMNFIVKNYPKYFWVCVVFIQAFVQNMFSGAIYSASWLAIGSGLILGMSLEKTQNNNSD